MSSTWTTTTYWTYNKGYWTCPAIYWWFCWMYRVYVSTCPLKNATAKCGYVKWCSDC
ncbi:MAG: hypothetical protein QXG12_07055 [Thermoproteota archaeon]